MNRTTALQRKIEAIKSLSTSSTERTIQEIEYKEPSLNLLNEYTNDGAAVRLKPADLEDKIAEFGFDTAVEDIRTGPVISRYELKLARGVRLSQIRNVSDDLALALMSETIRIQAPIPGTNRVGIEIANEKQNIIGLKSILQDYDTSIENFGGRQKTACPTRQIRAQ